MKLAEENYKFILLTPAMIGGATVSSVELNGSPNPNGPRRIVQGSGSKPEMRISSARGQIRYWHRNVNLNAACNEVWGQTEPNVIASKIDLSLQPTTQIDSHAERILPHAQRDNSMRNPWAKVESHRNAISYGSQFTLTLRRLVGCDKDQWTAAQKAVKLWLLLGGLGLRVNRAAGSVWPLDSWAPQDEDEFRQLLEKIGYDHPVQLADASLGNSPQALRKEASDSVSVRQYFGGIAPRQLSPIKMKVIRFGDSHRLLLTGLDTNGMQAARHALQNKKLGQVNWITL